MRPEELAAGELFEATGQWEAKRKTICTGCGRYTVTDAERWCRRCAVQVAVQDELAGFELDDEEAA